MNNKDNFLQLVSTEDTKTIAEVKDRIKNRAMLRESQQIALKVLMKLDELGWLQKDLAREMNVSPQQISKIVSGKENLTIETQIKLQNILNIPVLASYYENKINAMEEWVLIIPKCDEKVVVQTNPVTNNYHASKTVNMGSHTFPKKYVQAAI